MSLNHPWLRLVAIEVAFLAIGRFLGAVVSLGKAGWYELLVKSTLSPAGWVFGVVWTGLYLILGFVGWTLWEEHARGAPFSQASRLFVLQLVMNWAWTPLFFAAHWLWVSFFWIVAMVPLVLAVMVLLWADGKKLCAALLLPYVLWLGFASYLAGYMAVMN